MKKVYVPMFGVLVFVLTMFGGCSAPRQDDILPSNAPGTPSPALTTIPSPTATPLPTFNPDGKLPLLTYSGDQATGEAYIAPPITVWALKQDSTKTVDGEAIRQRLWGDAKYETTGEGEDIAYRLPLYGSTHGRFREYLGVWDTGFSHRWESNENTPKSQTYLTDAKAVEDARKQAHAYALDILQDDDYVKNPAAFALPWDEDGTQMTTFCEVVYEHLENGIAVAGDGARMRVESYGIVSFYFSWANMVAADIPKPTHILTLEEALYALNYARSFVAVDQCSEHSDDNYITRARLVYSTAFSGEENLYVPAWEFTLSRHSRKYVENTILVDAATGNTYGSHDGLTLFGDGGREPLAPLIYDGPSIRSISLPSSFTRKIMPWDEKAELSELFGEKKEINHKTPLTQDEKQQIAYEYALKSLGDAASLQHLRVDPAQDEQGTVIFTWEHWQGDVAVFDEYFTVYVESDGQVSFIKLQWSELDASGRQEDAVMLTLDEALDCLQYARTHIPIFHPDLYSEKDKITSARMVLTSVFANDEQSAVPAWEFTLMGAYEQENTVLIDGTTGDIYNAFTREITHYTP